MRNTSVSAVAIQTGSERSNVLGTEQLHEALLDLFGALVDLVGIDHQHLQLGELRTIRWIRHVGMSDVEALAVGEDLLDLAREDEVGEETRGVRTGSEAHDRRR